MWNLIVCFFMRKMEIHSYKSVSISKSKILKIVQNEVQFFSDFHLKDFFLWNYSSYQEKWIYKPWHCGQHNFNICKNLRFNDIEKPDRILKHSVDSELVTIYSSSCITNGLWIPLPYFILFYGRRSYEKRNIFTVL